MAVFREGEDSYTYKIVGLVALLFNDVDWQGEARYLRDHGLSSGVEKEFLFYRSLQLGIG